MVTLSAWRSVTLTLRRHDQRRAGLPLSCAREGGDEARDFTPIEAPEFRRLGDEGAQGRLAYARRAGQKVGVGLPGWALADRAVDVPIELGKLGLQEQGGR